MLYPSFDDLLSLKELKFDLSQPLMRSSSSIILGGQHSPFRGHGLEFDYVRQYVPGDDIRNIDWRVTARTGAPHLKVFRQERERQIILCVDMNASMRFGTKNTFKSVQAARTAALLGWKGLANHDRVSACLFGDVPKGIEYFSPKKSRKNFLEMLKRFSEPVLEKNLVDLQKVFQHVNQAAKTGSLVYFISDFMNLHPNLQQEAYLSHLNKRCDVIFISINDLAEKALIPVGQLKFCNTLKSDKEKININTDHLAGRQNYKKQWEDNRQQLYQLSSSLKIPLLELTTESDMKKRPKNRTKQNCNKEISMNTAYFLEKLHDIEGLDQISIWPLALGSWILIALGIGFLGLLIWILKRWVIFKRSWKNDTFKKLRQLEKNLTDENARHTVMMLSEYLRRIALKRFSRKECAALMGYDWLKWLSQNDPSHFKWEEKGKILIEIPYAPLERNLSALEIKELIQATKNWVC